MKKNKIAFFVALFALAACSPNPEQPSAEYVQYDYDDVNEFVYYQPVATGTQIAEPVTAGKSVIKYSVPNDSDLVLETAHHVIQIQGNQNQPYAYYVWAGGKDYTADPDLIVDEGVPAVLKTDQEY